MASKDKVPGYDKLLNPTLMALHQLGGSASIQELVDEMASALDLPSDVVEVPHGSTGRTEIEYRAAWARTYLKNAGLVENSERGVWSLTAKGAQTKKVDGRTLTREVHRKLRERRLARKGEEASEGEDDVDEGTWQDELLQVLQAMDPFAFERLCQRLLRESGFIEVEVTSRSGDGGIDGNGIIRIGGLISFNVLFQSKRYKGNIGPDVVRDFRGAMIGRADKGLIITTGGFTREARKEATRDGAPPVDLIDGQLLVEKLKELRLGVSTKQVEEVMVNREWFDSI
ncbi:MAG: restriction endonuclease [Planctomycetota bacterium]